MNNNQNRKRTAMLADHDLNDNNIRKKSIKHPLTPNHDDISNNNWLNHFRSLSDHSKSLLLNDLISYCSNTTLQSAACIILPKFKINYLADLPVELEYLDTKSLLRCAQVSKAWNDLVDGKGSESQIWKKRIIEQAFAIESQLSQNFLLTFPNPFGSDNLYKAFYRHHHLTRQNWFLGRYRQISFPGHGTHVVTCLQFDGDKIISGSDDRTIHIYDTKLGELITRLEGHEGGVWALQYWQNILVSGSTDRTVRVWNM
ncbi:hypothetical protein BC833DRAFT_662284, partial [Globomyces pollinis-pini]